MAFAIANTPEVPKWKTDYSPVDRQENYNKIVDYIGQYLPATPTGASISYVEATKVATLTVDTPAHGTLSYQWAASTTADGSYTDISGATSTTFTATSSQSEKYLGCKVTNTLNGVATTLLVKYGKLPVIS